MTTTRALRSWLLAGLLAPATLTASPAWAAVRFVADCGDSGLQNQLRDVINDAASGDIIAVPFCTITLTGPAEENANAGGDLDIIGKSVTIIGVGPGRTIIDGGGLDRVFELHAGAGLTLIGMTIQNGHPPNNGSGGGIRAIPPTTLTLTNVVVSGNQADAGGGIATESNATLNHVIIRDNVSFSGGGLRSFGGTVLITNSVIADNRAESSGGGIFSDGRITIVNSRIVRNRADSDSVDGGDGGGLLQFSGPMTLRRTVLARNLVGPTGSGPDCFALPGKVLTALGQTRTQTGCGILTSSSVGDDQIGVNPLLPSDIVVGAGAGGGPHVRALDPTTGAEVRSFFAYNAAFTGGVRVAACDLTGDGVPDIVTGAGAGGGPHVRAFDGVDGAPLAGAIASFFPYAAGFTGGVVVGCADVNKDGVADVITGPGAGGGPHVRAFSGLDAADLFNAFVFNPGFTGGVFVGP